MPTILQRRRTKVEVGLSRIAGRPPEAWTSKPNHQYCLFVRTGIVLRMAQGLICRELLISGTLLRLSPGVVYDLSGTLYRGLWSALRYIPRISHFTRLSEHAL